MNSELNLLSNYVQKPNTLFIENLKKVYSIRSEVINGKKQDVDCDVKEITKLDVFSDGKGYGLLAEFDKLYDLHNEYPKKQYELFNTSFVDTLIVTSILETRVLIKEISELIKVFELKYKECPARDKMSRNNGPYIDMPVNSMFKNWCSYLAPFVISLEKDIQMISKVPLGSKIFSKDFKMFFNSTIPKEVQILHHINKTFDMKLISAEDRIVAMSQMGSFVNLSGSLNSLASTLMKIANDVRFLSSGPRSGFGEMIVPENEPGSSIMPGKVNPTQCESLSMVASQVIGNHTAITLANSVALFESNNFKPLICNNLLRSIKITADGIRSFNKNCAVGIKIIIDSKF